MGGVNKARHPGLLPVSQDHRPAARPKGCCRWEPESREESGRIICLLVDRRGGSARRPRAARVASP